MKLARKWATRKKMSDDPAKFIYEVVVCVLIVIAIIYSVATGTAPENTGF